MEASRQAEQVASDEVVEVAEPAEPIGHVIDGVDWSKAVATSPVRQAESIVRAKRHRKEDRERKQAYLGDPDELSPWEEQYAKWLALQVYRVSADEEDMAVRLLHGKSVSPNALRKIKRKLEFRRVYESARVEVNEIRLKTARSRAIAILPKGIKAYGEAIDVLRQELKGKERLSALRTAAGLLTPALDRTLPKKTEITTHATQVTVNLTAEQAAGMTSPIMVVEATEVQAIPAVTP